MKSLDYPWGAVRWLEVGEDEELLVLDEAARQDPIHFLALMNHEWRTALHIIFLAADALQNNPPELLTPQLTELPVIIEKYARRLLRIGESFMHFADNAESGALAD